jgi:hypothetical protein
MGNRFYMFQLTDLWMTDFATPSTRTAGGAAANYIIIGPDWHGTVPTEIIECPLCDSLHWPAYIRPKSTRSGPSQIGYS